MQQPYKVESLELAIAKLEPNPWNPNEMDDFMLTKAEESWDRFGQVKRVIVRPHPKDKGRYQILDGEHRTRLAGHLGHQSIRCEVIHDIPDSEAKRLGLALNDIHGENSKEKLGQILCEIYQDDDAALPWTEEELAQLTSMNGIELEEADDEDYEEDVTPEPPQDSRLTPMLLLLTDAGKSKLEQAVGLLKTELPDVQDKRELLGLVVERLCEEYL